jgi:hypothetical protein
MSSSSVHMAGRRHEEIVEEKLHIATTGDVKK